jgi:hypothetical protein
VRAYAPGAGTSRAKIAWADGEIGAGGVHRENQPWPSCSWLSTGSPPALTT